MRTPQTVDDQRCLHAFYVTHINSIRRCNGGGEHLDLVEFGCVLEVNPVTIVGTWCGFQDWFV